MGSIGTVGWRVVSGLVAIASMGCGDGDSGGAPASTDTGASADVSTIDASDTSPVDEGTDTAATDTAPKSCTSPLDCGDVSLFVCDPITRTCVAPTCDTKTKPCPANRTCVQQASGVTVGICVHRCEQPGDPGTCAAGQACVVDRPSLTFVCASRGKAALGEPCTVNSFDTGCAEGLCHKVKATDATGTCVKECDPLTATATTCPTGTVCDGKTWACSLDAAAADPATKETFCTTEGAACDVVDGAALGVCLKQNGALICRSGCRTYAPGDCPAGLSCAYLAPGATLGVCLPFFDGTACNDGGSGTCAACRTAEETSGGCCETQLATCTTTACKAFVDCAIACKRDPACISGCVTPDPAAAKLGTPGLLCLTAFGSPSPGACADVCDGPAVCGDFDGPTTASTCVACKPTDSTCRKNGCFNGYYCNRTTNKCAGPWSIGTCP